MKELEGRLAIVRSRAEQATGQARLRLQRIERGLPSTLDASVLGIESVMKGLEPRLRSALRQTKAFQRGVQAGIRSGAKAYRRVRRREGGK